jgi:hypothetical protein
VKIGLISDTHGLLRPEAVRALAGVSQIIHAGDVGGPEVVEGLRSIAPVHAVRGNNDRDAWARRSLPLRLSLDIAGFHILVLHDLNELGSEAETKGYGVVVAGHSHKPAVVQRSGTLFVNPGSAGPRRFNLPITIGYLIIAESLTRAEICNLVLPDAEPKAHFGYMKDTLKIAGDVTAPVEMAWSVQSGDEDHLYKPASPKPSRKK